MNVHFTNHLNELIKTRDLGHKISLGLALQELRPVSIPLAACTMIPNQPGRPDSLKILDARNMPKRGHHTRAQRLSLLHALTNIELLAIELPALALLRFGCDDLIFIQDSIKVIQDECKHFQALSDFLSSQDLPFGTLPVHNGLWDYALKCHSLLEHVLIIPCYLEARGLDVTPNFIRQFYRANEMAAANILQMILDDEVGHVQVGLNYADRVAQSRHTSRFKLIECVWTNFFGNKLSSKVSLEYKLRYQAGFTPSETALIAPISHQVRTHE